MLKSELKKSWSTLGMVMLPVLGQADVSAGNDVKSNANAGYLPGEMVKVGQLPAGYNQSSSFVCQNPWNVFLTADYTYWIWQQELLEVATLVTPTAAGAAGFLNGTSEVIFQTPGYTSGFQVGLGCNLRGVDDWIVYSEYTWYQNSDSMRTLAGDSQYLAVSPLLIKHVGGATPGVLLSDNLFTKARIHVNDLDLVMQRPFYFGKKLTANFIAGLHALWINQTFKATGSELSFIGSNANIPIHVNGAFNSNYQQRSWGLGPKFGVDSNWLLGCGVRIMGSMAMSALYTSYIRLNSQVTGSVSDVNLATLTIDQSHNYNTVNPVLQSSLGMGWGSYFAHNNMHFDVSACYDFNVFWSQDIINSLLNVGGSPGNMLLQGLNIQARFDF